MNYLIIGNIIAFLGSIILVLNGLFKEKKQIIISQSIMAFTLAIANIFLKGYSAVIADMLQVIRNIISLKWPFKLPLKIGFIVILSAITIVTNTESWLGYLPLLATIIFTIILDTEKEEVLKIAIIISEFLWLTYDLFHKNYAGSSFDTLTILTNLYTLFALIQNKKNPEPEQSSDIKQ